MSFNEFFEMKILLLLLTFLVSGFSYQVPDNFVVIHSFQENGLLTVVDNAGNGANIYIEYKQDALDENPFEDYNLEIIEDIKFRDGGHLVKFDNVEPIDPFDSAFYFQKRGIAVYAFIYKDGPSETHSVFEEKTMQLARDIAQGGKNEKAWSDLWSFSFHSDHRE